MLSFGYWYHYFEAVLFRGGLFCKNLSVSLFFGQQNENKQTKATHEYDDRGSSYHYILPKEDARS